jgi:hypothetical protein
MFLLGVVISLLCFSYGVETSQMDLFAANAYLRVPVSIGLVPAHALYAGQTLARPKTVPEVFNPCAAT